jgi:ribose transport system permease protein
MSGSSEGTNPPVSAESEPGVGGATGIDGAPGVGDGAQADEAPAARATGLAAPGAVSGHRFDRSQLGRLTNGRMRAAGIVIPLIVLFIVLSVASSSFATKANLLNILDQQASTLVIAGAGTLVLVSGGIDLSVGAVYGLSSVIAGELVLHGMAAGLAIALGVLSGLFVGLVNGVVATVFRINSLIATLATSFVIAGIGTLITQGNLLVLAGKPAFGELSNTNLLGVHTSTWTMVVVVVALGVLLARTTIGRYMYAAGGNPEAARLAGVRINLVRVIAFSLSGGAAALGGIIDSSRVLSAQATNDTTLTFTVIAGIVLAGTSILGGEGVVWRTVVGVLLIALIGNGYDLLNLNQLYEQITLGVIILLAVGIDAWSRGLVR